MKKLVVCLFAVGALVAVMAPIASANTVHVGVCDLSADTPYYSGTTAVFVAHTDNCGTFGTGAAHYLQMCEQSNRGSGWSSFTCTGQQYANAVGQRMTGYAYAYCGVWYRTWAWADVLWEGVWTSGAVTSNASYRC